MKQISLKKLYSKRGVASLSVIMVISLFLLSSFRRQQRLNDEVWKILGITKKSGDEKIQNSFMYGYLSVYGVKNLKNIAVNNRTAIAKDLLNYTKEFVNSAGFKKQYAEARESATPEEPVKKPLRTIAEIQKDEIAKTEKSIKETEKTIREIPSMEKTMKPLLEMFQKNLKEYQNPKHSYFEMIAQGEKYSQESDERNYRDRMTQWEKNFPADMNLFIAERLEDMLNSTKDIDYNAQLVEKYGKKRFVNPVYEGKGTDWKQGFRAGREVTETARAFAAKWLSEIKSAK